MTAPRIPDPTPEPAAPGVFEVYPTLRPPGRYRWRLVSADGLTTMVGGSLFTTEQDAVDDARGCRDAASGAAISVLATALGGVVA